MIKGYSLRKSAEILEVSYVTLFYWRHKILSALKQIPTADFDGIVEIDENYLAWFKYLYGNCFEDTEKNIKEMLIASCLYKESETYESLRTSKFSV